MNESCYIYMTPVTYCHLTSSSSNIDPSNRCMLDDVCTMVQQPIALGVAFIQSQKSINSLVLYVSFATSR